jgi:hypothetical protein
MPPRGKLSGWRDRSNRQEGAIRLAHNRLQRFSTASIAFAQRSLQRSSSFIVIIDNSSGQRFRLQSGINVRVLSASVVAHLAAEVKLILPAARNYSLEMKKVGADGLPRFQPAH